MIQGALVEKRDYTLTLVELHVYSIPEFVIGPWGTGDFTWVISANNQTIDERSVQTNLGAGDTEEINKSIEIEVPVDGRFKVKMHVVEDDKNSKNETISATRTFTLANTLDVETPFEFRETGDGKMDVASRFKITSSN